MPAEFVPPGMEGVEIAERLGETIPLDLTFTDEYGKQVTLRDYFHDGGKPVLLTPVYYACPQLCTLVLNGLVDAMEDVEWSPGREFTILTYSVAEEETTELADRKKRAYLSQYRREGAGDGWHFLTGSKESIKALSDAIGFHFKRQPDGLIAHSASIVFVTPDGQISRYMNDVLFQPRDVRLALIESSEGAIGSPMEKFLLFNCFQYDPDSNSYAASAVKIMRLGGVVTLITILAGVFVLWVRGSKAEREEQLSPGGAAT